MAGETFTATTGTDVRTQTVDDDTVQFTNLNQINSDDAFDGGDGSDTIAILTAPGYDADLRDVSFANYERVWVTPGGRAIFDASQFGTGLISNSLATDGFVGGLKGLIMIEGATNFSAADWTFTAWSPNIVISGSSGADSIIGSSSADEIDLLDGGADTADGGAGNDTFLVMGYYGGIPASVTGGVGADTFKISFFSLDGATFEGTLEQATLDTLAFLAGGSYGNIDFTTSTATFSHIDRVLVDFGSFTVKLSDALVATADGNKDGTLGDLLIEGTSSTTSLTLDGSAVTESYHLIVGGTLNGTDLITGGAGSDTINSGAGADTIVGSLGADSMSSGTGADTFQIYGAAQLAGDTINGGTDTVLDELWLSAGSYDFATASVSRVDQIILYDENDLSLNWSLTLTDAMVATADGDQNGTLGDLTIMLFAGISGDVVIDGSALASGHSLTLWAEAGRLSGNSTITGGAGNDVLWTGTGNDWVRAGAGNDTMESATGSDTLEGGAGNDTFLINRPSYVSANDSIDGGANTDTLVFDFDYLWNSENGLDFDVSAAGAIFHSIERIAVAAGDTSRLILSQEQFGAGLLSDTLEIGLTNPVYSSDFTVKVIGATDFSADGWVLTVTTPADTRIVLEGTSGDDSITGSDYRDLLEGGAGKDTLSSGDGDDTIDAGEGANNVDGGGGTDVVLLSGTWADYSISFSAGTYTIIDLGSGHTGTGTVTNVETLSFAGDEFAIADTVDFDPVAVDDDNNGTSLVESGASASGFGTASGNLLTNDSDANVTAGLFGDSFTVTGILAGSGSAGFTAVVYGSETEIRGTYGTLVLNNDGSYTYTLDDADPQTQALADGETGYEVFTYEVSDTKGGFDTATLTLDIAGTNDGPGVTSDLEYIVAENTLPSIQMTAVDPDSTGLTWSISGTDAGQFNVDGSTGVVTFKTAPDREAPTDANHDNDYTFMISVSDGSLTYTKGMKITVSNTNEAPVITSNGGGATAAISISENTTAVTTVTSTDPEGTPRSYTLTGDDAGKFSIGSDGKLRFVTAPNREAPTDLNHDNVYKVIVTASDGTLIDTQALSITVANVNEAPVITSNGGGSLSLAVNENATAVTTIIATDVDGPSKSFSLSGADASLFKISSTGVVSFKAAPDFETPGDAGKNNVYNVTVKVSDGSLFDTQNLAITVKNVTGNSFVGTAGNDTIDLTHKISGKGATIEADKIDGKDGNDTIRGSGGDDTLIGGLGNDLLVGDAGKDKFVFNTKLGPANIDRIGDFTHDTDLIQLDDATFKMIGSTLDAAEFYAKAGATAAHDANDRIIYDKNTGKLFFDDDGTGSHAAIHFATLSSKPQTLDHGDFTIV